MWSLRKKIMKGENTGRKTGGGKYNPCNMNAEEGYPESEGYAR